MVRYGKEAVAMVRERRLNGTEIEIANSVYASVLPYDRIYITDLELGGAVTLAGMDLRTQKFDYTINWTSGFANITDSAYRRSTLIHELCHVWQGENGVWPTFYMGQSIWAQLSSGLRDIWKQRKWKGWGEHRSTAYPFSARSIGNNWSTFNVEQQASLVESWYIPEGERFRDGHNFGEGVYGGGRSVHDSRYPYIRDVIRARDRKAIYVGSGLPHGGDLQIKAIQDKLVALGYLEAHQADGIVGRSRSATLDAVEAFQRRNGLKPDRDLGGPNSQTRRMLALPVGQLVRK
jgi:hypothetical protein